MSKQKSIIDKEILSYLNDSAGKFNYKIISKGHSIIHNDKKIPFKTYTLGYERTSDEGLNLKWYHSLYHSLKYLLVQKGAWCINGLPEYTVPTKPTKLAYIRALSITEEENKVIFTARIAFGDINE